MLSFKFDTFLFFELKKSTMKSKQASKLCSESSWEESSSLLEAVVRRTAQEAGQGGCPEGRESRRGTRDS